METQCKRRARRVLVAVCSLAPCCTQCSPQRDMGQKAAVSVLRYELQQYEVGIVPCQGMQPALFRKAEHFTRTLNACVHFLCAPVT